MEDRVLAQAGPALAGAQAGGLGAGLVSSHWYRVATLAPQLRGTLRLHSQRWRGELWTVVEDRINAKYHRFDRQALRIIRLLDGRRTLDQLWQALAADSHEDTPSQEDILALLGQLHALDLLAGDALPDLAEVIQRDRRQARKRWAARYLNPLAIRVPLLDPDRWLGRIVQPLQPILGWRGVLLWCLLVLPALPIAASHWTELTGNFSERMLALDNLLLLLLIFPLVKALHELGHGIACKLHGGEVHDMGVMLLLFLPVPYVEASSAWAFKRKRDRMLVGAAGMLVELGIAAIAFYLWLFLQPGTARGIAYDVVVLASLTTVIFNANPLLRYDGYFVLSDAIEIPNLAQRAGRWWGWLFQRHALRRRQVASPANSTGEAVWLALYSPLSFAYRVFVMFSIAIFVATQYFAVGVLIAVWALLASFGMPLWKALSWLARHTVGASARGGARAVVLSAIALVLGLLFLLPLPHKTEVAGVLWLPDSAILRARQAGFVTAMDARPGDTLAAGASVLTLADPELEAKIAAQTARAAAAVARYEAARVEGPAAGERFAVELRQAQAELKHLQSRSGLLTVRSESAGRLWQVRSDDLPGVYVRKGEVIGYVIPPAPPHVRLVIEQADEDLIRQHSKTISVRLPFAPSPVWPATVLRAVPAATNELPSAALGLGGGGSVVTDPRDDSGRKSLTTHFELDLALPPEFPHRLIGSLVSVRFEHAAEPIAPRVWRGLRRLFLAHFHA